MKCGKYVGNDIAILSGYRSRDTIGSCTINIQAHGVYFKPVINCSNVAKCPFYHCIFVESVLKIGILKVVWDKNFVKLI